MKELSLQDQTTEVWLYTAPNGEVKIEVLLNNETIWLIQERIAELFDVQRPAITKHLKNIFDSGELDEQLVCSVLEHTTEHGAMAGKTQARAVKHYNLGNIFDSDALERKATISILETVQPRGKAQAGILQPGCHHFREPHS